MDLQKKKTSTKKIKSSKTDIPHQNPLGPLMQQINQLKSELASLKSKKSTKPNKEYQENQQKSHKDMNTTVSSGQYEIKLDKAIQKVMSGQKDTSVLKQILFPIREHELKINIQLNKLNQIIKELDPDKIIHSLNKIFQYISNSVRELEIENRKIQTIPVNQDAFYNWKQQGKLYQELNNELEKQNIQLKHIMAKQVGEIDRLQAMCADFKEEIQQISNSFILLEQENEKMKLICEGIRQQRQQMEQKIRIYQKSIEKKQSQILMYQEDVNFIRIEADKNKSHKRQAQKMLDSLQKDYRELKSKYEIQFEALTKQKNKWKNECQSRRSSERQNINHEEQKNQLKKQLQTMRRQLKVLSDQMIQIKQRLSEQQKKNIIYEQENYRLESQNQKLLRSSEFYRVQMRQISNQVQLLREQSQKYRDMAIKSKVGVKNLNKTLALQQIQELIKKHKTSQDGDIK